MRMGLPGYVPFVCPPILYVTQQAQYQEEKNYDELSKSSRFVIEVAGKG